MQTNQFGQPIGAPVAWQPRPPMVAAELPGQHVRLVPLAEEHLGDLYRAAGAPGDDSRWTYLPIGPFDTEQEFRAAFEAVIADPGLVSSAILATDGRAVGTASYLRVEPSIGTIEVGWILYSASLARSAAATEAMYLMADHAIGTLGYRRYEWKCDALNAPSRKAAERLGFRYEGTWRQATMYKGRNRDTAWFALTDSDWQALKPAYLTWLSPANFSPDGEQRQSLSALTAAALQFAAETP